jgi:hypothetical protein
MPSRVRGVFLAIAVLGLLGPFELEAYAQAGAGGAGGAAGGEKSGEGGAGAPSSKKAPAETKVAIFVEGAQAGEVRAEIEKSLPPGVIVLPDGPFIEALKKQHLLPLAKNIKGPAERQKATSKLQLAAQEVGAQAGIVASAPAAKAGKFDIPILIMPSDSTELLSSVNATGSVKDNNQPRAEAIAGVVSAAISGILPVVTEEPPPKVEEPKVEEKPPEKPKVEEKKPEPPPVNKFLRGKFLFELGLGTQGRSFFYIMPPGLEQGDNVRDYRSLFIPHAFLRADVFPFAGPDDTFLNNIGLTGSVGRAFGLSSTLSGGGREEPETGVETTFFHFRVGPKVRFLLGPGDRAPMITGEITYSNVGFTFADAKLSSPSFIYQSVRPGVGARVPVGPVAVLFEGGLHYVYNAGDLDGRFPNAGVLGFDAQLGVALPLGKLFEARLNVNYTRYRGNLKADLDRDAAFYTGYIAAGSVDQFFGAHLGVAVAP